MRVCAPKVKHKIGICRRPGEMADDANVQLIIRSWKCFDLAKLQKQLDETATQILNRQDDSDYSRRKLVELYKDFKRTSPEDVLKSVSPLVKSFQFEIDNLSKRSKAAEAAFLFIYKHIIDIVDPLPLLEKWFNENNSSKISRIPLPDDDGCILSDVNQELEEIKKKKQIDSDLDFISNHKSPIQQANQELTIINSENKVLATRADRDLNNSSTEQRFGKTHNDIKLTKQTQEESVVAASNIATSNIATSNSATSSGSNLLFEHSIDEADDVQHLQSALNQSQSSKYSEANSLRNEKLFYAKDRIDEVLVDKTLAIMSDSEKDIKNEENNSNSEDCSETATKAQDNQSLCDAVNLMKNKDTQKVESSSMDTSKSHSSLTSSSSLSSSLESGLAAKEKEISELVDDIQRLQSTIVKLKETTARKISQLEEIISEKTKIIKHLENRLESQQDYDEIKRELSLIKIELSHGGASLRENKPFEMYLVEKTKALQTENAALKVANAELSNSLSSSRHLIPPFIPGFQSLGNVESFGSMLGEEIVSSYAKAFRREMAAAAAAATDLNNSTNATGSPSPPPTSNDDAKSIASDGADTPTPTPTPTSSAINCNDEPLNNGNNTLMNDRLIPNRSRDSPISSMGASYDKLQQNLRMNVEKYMNENLNTLNISRCVRELLSVHNIGQRLFAKYVLGLSQGTVSELLSKPKPWDKLTEKGRDSYRKMHAWAADESCIYLLKAMVPRKGKETTSFQKDDPAAEERIAQILSEAQRAMVSPKNGSRGPGTPLVNGDSVKSEKQNDENQSENGDERSEKSPGSAAALAAMSSLYRNNDARRVLRKFEADDIPQDMVNRIYQEELAKLIGQQVEEGFRHPHGIAGFERSQDEIRQALAIYHQELSRLTQMASVGASPNSPSNSELIARFTAASAAAAAAGLVNGNYLGLPHLLDSTLPLDARIRTEKQTNGSSRESRDTFSSSETDLRQGSAFSLVRPKQETNSNNKSFSSSTGQNGPILNSNNSSNNSNEMNSAEDLSSAASPLQRMQSITNSLLSQSSMPSVPSTPNRPAKAVLPPITQQQFDQYNNLNTEDIVKKVKEQLSQYSISQRLFGESVLGLSQGSVSDLLARPKPWHMLTQKGREPFIRMKMFLEDENAIHKLVASQYKIAPEKLMRTGSFVAGGTPTPIATGVTPTSNNNSPNISSSASLAAMKTASLRGQETSNIKSLENCRQSISPGFNESTGHRSSTSTPDQNISSSNIQSPYSNSNSIRRISQQQTTNRSSSLAYMQPSVYEMAALTTDLDTQSITTKIKETLMAHNIGQKIFGEVVLGLSQGSVSELLSKPKPWHMLSIKGREPFIRMQLWLNDAHNIEKLQALKNERREANKRRRNNLDDQISVGKSPLDNPIYNFSRDYNTSGSISGISPSHNPSGLINRTSFGGAPAAKKARILFSEEQKEALRVAFSMDPYPSTATIEFLANELNLSVRTITNWFHNHRMRLKQVTSNSDDGVNQTQLPYNLGRDTVNFDPIQFRVLLTQRLADVRQRNESSPSQRSKYSIYGSSSISSSIYANTNSCSSPDSLQEDDMGTLDLSMPSQHNKKLNRSNDDSDESVNSPDESVELDLSKSSRTIGSSRRKPQLVTSSSSRRKPAQPQWVNPGLEFSGDEDEDDYVDDGLSDDMVDDEDDDIFIPPNRSEIINGVCVRQTDYNMIKRRLSLEDDETVRVEPIPAGDTSLKSKVNLSNNDKERQNKIQRLEKSVREEEEGWDDDDDDGDITDNGEDDKLKISGNENQVDCVE